MLYYDYLVTEPHAPIIDGDVMLVYFHHTNRRTYARL